MKTYPFILVLIRLYWLALIILLGILFSPLYTYLWPTPIEATSRNLEKKDFSSNPIDPELATSIAVGKKLFKDNCASCHNRDMKSNMTGPALSGVRDRWSDYPITDLYNWIKNAAKMVEDGHPKAVEVFEKYDRRVMSSFTNLSDEEAESILVYVESFE